MNGLIALENISLRPISDEILALNSISQDYGLVLSEKDAKELSEMRKNAMLKIIPAYEGEVWCISKHLLAAAMRVFEVGTKALASGDSKTAYELFDQSYELYSMFWGLNMGMLTGDAKQTKTDKKSAKAKSAPAPVAKNTSKVSKLKSWVKNAVNCCIE